jgi:hypothetical protein
MVKPIATPHPRTPHLCSAPIRYAVHVSGQVAPDVRPGNRGEHQRTPTDQRACTSRLKIHSLGFLRGFLQAPQIIASALGGAAFEVACQASGAHQVGEEPLDDPPFGQHHETAHVVAALDDRQDQRERGQAVLDEVPV